MEFLCALVFLFGCSLHCGHCAYIWPNWINGTNCADAGGYYNNRIAEKGCWGYLKCIGDKNDVFRCHPEKVLDITSNTCVEPEAVIDSNWYYRCNYHALCLGRNDGLYTNPNNATECFRCKSELFTELVSCEDGGLSPYQWPPALNDYVCHDPKKEKLYYNNTVVKTGCWGYYKCIEGAHHMRMCYPDEVLDYSTMTCVKPEPVMNSCNRIALCSKMEDGLYANPNNGAEYFRCKSKLFTEVLSCGADEKFSEESQSCEPEDILG